MSPKMAHVFETIKIKGHKLALCSRQTIVFSCVDREEKIMAVILKESGSFIKRANFSKHNVAPKICEF